MRPDKEIKKLDKDLTAAVRMFGEKYRWLGENRATTWEIYKKYPWLYSIETLSYWGTLCVAYAALYNAISTYYAWFSILTLINNTLNFLFPLNWDLVKINFKTFEFLFQLYCILGFYIPMIFIFRDWRIVTCVVNIFVESLFLLSDANTDFDKRKAMLLLKPLLCQYFQ